MGKKFCFFWRSGPFTQWYPCKFTGISEFDESGKEREFNSTEQWMMFSKALLFNDLDVADKIMQTSDPAKIKRYGREVRGFSERTWVKQREEIVYAGNKLKFTQDEALLEIFLNTAPKTFVEASPSDKIWGIGMKENDPNAVDPSKWKGLNLLGGILTQLRDDLSVNKDSESRESGSQGLIPPQNFPDLDNIDEFSDGE